MTGEHKAALIISFTVVLLVGVLISDHLSEAQQRGTDAGDDSSHPVLVVQAPTRPDPEPAQSYSPERETGGPLGRALGGGAEIDQTEHVDPIVITQGSVAAPGGSDDATASLLERLREAVTGAGGLGASPTPVPAPTVRDEPRETPRYHHVLRNESLYVIAEKYYGDGNQWRKLADANADRVGADGALRAGVALRIPDASELGVDAPRRAEPAPRRSTGEARTVRVARGQTLGEIAQRELGSVRRLPDLLAANPAIKDANDIREGMELVLPEGG